VLETPTWRASADWASRLGYDAHALDGANRDAVWFLRSLGDEFPTVDLTVRSNIGPRGDGYNPGELLMPDDAASYHRAQIESFVAAGADRVTMLTATHTGEAIGVVRAAAAADIPVVIAFTVETDGRLPSEQALHEAIADVDAATDGAPNTSGSTAPTPITSPRRWTPTQPRSGASGCSGPTRRVRATPSWTKPKSSTTATQWSWPISTQTWSVITPTSRSSADAAAPTPATSRPSPTPASHDAEADTPHNTSAVHPKQGSPPRCRSGAASSNAGTVRSPARRHPSGIARNRRYGHPKPPVRQAIWDGSGC
jgi:hypothetical protein